eukprot:1140736-Pelagomonas_calceolata.AAC.3
MSHPAPPACNTLRFLIASRFLSLLYLMLPHYCIPCLQCIPIPHFPTLLCLSVPISSFSHCARVSVHCRPAGPVLVAKVSKGGMVLHSGSATGVLPLCAWQGHLRPRSGGGVLCRWVAGCAGCVGRCSNKDYKGECWQQRHISAMRPTPLYMPCGVLCGALDAEGGVHEVTPELWRNCALASFLRSELYDPELTMHSEVLHRCLSLRIAV